MKKQMGNPYRTENGFTSGAIRATCLFSDDAHTAVRLEFGGARVEVICSRGGGSAYVSIFHVPKRRLKVSQYGLDTP